MTLAEQARLIERQQFEAESKAALKRALANSARRASEDNARVAKWLGKPAPKGAAIVHNVRKAALYTHQGQTKTIAEWAEIKGISITTLRARLRTGMPLAEALTMPLNQRSHAVKLHTINGVSKTLQQWADDAGITYDALTQRMSKGCALAEAVATPCERRNHYGNLHSINGVSKTLKQWAEEAGVAYNTLFERIKSGRTLAEAVNMPKGQRRKRRKP